jgi:hypothetical protein
MKYLSNYIEEAQTKVMREYGAFWAFSDEQFKEQKAEDLKAEEYTHLFAGLMCPKDNAKSLLDGLDEVVQKGIQQDIEENGKDNIIKRELANHEAYYSRSIESTEEALKGYNFTREDILKIYKEEYPKQEF